MSQELNSKVMVAMDVDSRSRALELADQLAGSGCWIKVGMELYNATGQAIIHEMKTRGFNVFLDLKLHDIPNTVESAVRVLASYGADLLTIHCSGGSEMMSRAVKATHDVQKRSGATKRTQIVGITVLTSLDQDALENELGVKRSVQDQVLALAKLAQKSGLDGVVASAQEAKILRETMGPEFLVVTPGIRPAGSERHDQARTLTPQAAIAAGSSYLVVGRPITKAPDPRAALEKLWD